MYIYFFLMYFLIIYILLLLFLCTSDMILIFSITEAVKNLYLKTRRPTFIVIDSNKK